MWYSIILIASLALIIITSVTFLNLGLKLAQTGAQPVKLIPKFKRKPKISAEQKEWMEMMDKIENFNGYERGGNV